LKLRKFGPKGSWALVTGASDGIGKEYANQLARAGYNVLLVSRTHSKLTAIASDIKSHSPDVEVDILSMDFSKNLDSDYASLTKLIADKDISILINNVGQSHSIPVPFAETPLDEMNNIITINCIATLKVTKLVLPSMQLRKRGLILSMGSFGGMIPTPLLATYSGSKAFLQQWSNAVASEVAHQGITVHFVHANLVTSAMSKIRRSTWQVPSEKRFVQAVLSKIGRRGGSIGFTHSGSPYWGHALIAAIITGVLGTFNDLLLEYNRNMHVSIRKRALAKAEREKAKGKKVL